MSIFPDDVLEDIEEDEEETEDTEETEEEYKEYEIDFSTGRLTGKIVTGVEAIKTWIYFALRTPRYRHTIFTWDYGNELESLIGQNYSEEHVQTEAEKLFEETLLVNEHIQSVSDVEVSVENDKVNITALVETIYGEVEVNV